MNWVACLVTTFWTCSEDYTLIMFCNPYIRRLSRKFLCLLSILAVRWSRKSLKLLSLYFGGFSSSTSSLAQVTFSCSAKPWVLAIEILASSRFKRAWSQLFSFCHYSRLPCGHQCEHAKRVEARFTISAGILWNTRNFDFIDGVRKNIYHQYWFFKIFLS